MSDALNASLEQGHQVEFRLETEPGSYPSDLVVTLVSPGPIPSEGQLSTFAAKLAGDDRIRLRLEAGIEVKLASR